jgi:hypothetical protein
MTMTMKRRNSADVKREAAKARERMERIIEETEDERTTTE